MQVINLTKMPNGQGGFYQLVLGGSNGKDYLRPTPYEEGVAISDQLSFRLQTEMMCYERPIGGGDTGGEW